MANQNPLSVNLSVEYAQLEPVVSTPGAQWQQVCDKSIEEAQNLLQSSDNEMQ